MSQSTISPRSYRRRLRGKRYLKTAYLSLAVGLSPGHALASDVWDLKAGQIKLLMSSSQIMVKHTANGFETQCRCIVALRPDEIPSLMKKALVAVEDRRFLERKGSLDFHGLFAMAFDGRGGSTIPMQLLKNVALGDLAQRRNLHRKVIELFHAGAISDAMSPDEIVTAYLNQVPFGGLERGGRDVIGLYRAARHHFHKEPKDLNLWEEAQLAAMVKAPALYNPSSPDPAVRERAAERAKLVLGLMVEQRYITKAQRENAIQAGSRPGALPDFQVASPAFADWIGRQWFQSAQVGQTLRVFVTLDPREQEKVDQALQRMVDSGTLPVAYQAAMIMMSPSGAVRDGGLG